MKSFEYELGFIGSGNMATALIRGILNSDLYKKDKIIASDKSKEARDRVKKEFGIKVCESNIEVVKKAKVILLCVKPQNMKEVLDEIKDEIESDQLIISIAAGVPISAIVRSIGKEIPVVRVMPNTASFVQKGMAGISYGPKIRRDHINIALDIFNSVGETIIVKEDLMDLITAVSGSGPGFIFRIMEHIVDAATRLGLKGEDAKRLVIQTFLGASFLSKESNKPLFELRRMVTSPGGTTEAGLSVFEKRGLGDIIHEAIDAAYRRSIEIKKQWER